jgi:hypothetical protein
MNATKARSRRFAWRLAVGALLALVAIAALGVVIAQQPRTADTFGYALPGANGLPGHFTYQGITYSNPHLCVDSAACQGAEPQRWSQAQLTTTGEWPMRQVATLPTLFGAGHAIYEPVNDKSMIGAGGPYVSDLHPFTLYLEVPSAPGWYYLYMRPGGP